MTVKFIAALAINGSKAPCMPPIRLAGTNDQGGREHRRRTGGNIGEQPSLVAERAALVLRLRSEWLTYRQVADAAGVSLPTAYRYGKAAAVC